VNNLFYNNKDECYGVIEQEQFKKIEDSTAIANLIKENDLKKYQINHLKFI